MPNLLFRQSLPFHLHNFFYIKSYILFLLALPPPETRVGAHKKVSRGEVLQKQVDKAIVSIKNQHNVPRLMATQC